MMKNKSSKSNKYRPNDFIGTPFNETMAPLCETSLWIAWGPYHVVDFFTDPLEETRAVRNSITLEDKSPLVKTFITGPDAERFVNYMQVRDATKMENYHANYTFWCDHDGFVVSEGILFKLEDQRYCHLAGPLLGWCQENATGFDVELYEAIEANQEFGVLAVQGARSQELIEAYTGEDWSSLKFSRGRKVNVDGVEITVWRQGYTGEAGYEVWVPEDHAAEVFQKILDLGKPMGAVPIGNAAALSARVEVGMLLVYTDYLPGGPDARTQVSHMESQEHLQTPAEMNFGRLVNLKKDVNFIGKNALLREAESGPGRVMWGMEINWREMSDLYISHGMPPTISPKAYRESFELQSKDGKRIGFATSITWSPNLNKMIGFAHIGSEAAKLGEDIKLIWRIGGKTGPVTATLAEMPFIEIVRSKN